MSLLILVVDDEPDVEALFRQQFRRDIRDGRFTMDFAQSADSALKLISDAAGASLILILSDINMPGMTGLELLPKAKAARPDVPVIMITAYGDADTRRKALEGGAEATPDKAHRFCRASQRDRQPCRRGRSRGASRRGVITGNWDEATQHIVETTGHGHRSGDMVRARIEGGQFAADSPSVTLAPRGSGKSRSCCEGPEPQVRTIGAPVEARSVEM